MGCVSNRSLISRDGCRVYFVAVAFFETYEKAGLRLLRHTWLNFDLLWAVALVVAGVAVGFC
jgi:hypothetical protein